MTGIVREDKDVLCHRTDKLFEVSVLPVKTLVNALKALVNIWLSEPSREHPSRP